MTSSEPPRFLLLLPPAPTPLNARTLRQAYGDTILKVLKEVALHSAEVRDRAAVLEIALACAHLVGHERAPRSTLYDATQSLVAGVYRLICALAARESVNVEDADGVDVRVLLVAWDVGVAEDGSEQDRGDGYGPVVRLRTLAASGRQWGFAFGVESEAGEAMVRAFVAAKESYKHGLERMRSGEGQQALDGEHVKSARDDGDHQRQRHYHTIIGGTFDHIHLGHKLLLTMLIFAMDQDGTEAERSATIGITGDQLLVNKKHAQHLESWSDRQRSVATFLNALFDFAPRTASGQRHTSVRDDPGPNGKSLDVFYPNGVAFKCTEIQDSYGPTITVEEITAIIVSAETRAGGKAVNDKRVEKGWKALEVFEVDVLDADEGEEGEDGAAKQAAKDGFESKLSSTAIREKLAKKTQSSSL